ncbi:MAG: deoxyguanosinetriphosphate triphosphohydrolase [Clostridia bacterium]|nr:deoxyguanosinetriphosphate triphosphohydrolase [Clostridia bacterium]
MTIREQTEKIERETLSPFATLSEKTKGRAEKAPLCDMRTEFQRDRDKIIHSKAFRRLKHKTQVFITPEGDHYRTRLTHTLEVSQIARTIARSLRLNEDLVEAMALGHDLGHTPFGHAGEAALNELCSDGFWHSKQSLRTVDVLENLNLTWEVRDGILNHPGDGNPGTLEGAILQIADRIAYINHDIDDACRGGIINEKDIPKIIVDVLGETNAERINTLICDVVRNSYGKRAILMSAEVEEAMTRLRNYMFDFVYVGSKAKEEEKKVFGIIKGIYEYYTENPGAMPLHLQEIAWKEGVETAVCDYIAGMSDRFAIYTFNNIYVPKSWEKL